MVLHTGVLHTHGNPRPTAFDPDVYARTTDRMKNSGCQDVTAQVMRAIGLQVVRLELQTSPRHFRVQATSHTRQRPTEKQPHQQASQLMINLRLRKQPRPPLTSPSSHVLGRSCSQPSEDINTATNGAVSCYVQDFQGTTEHLHEQRTKSQTEAIAGHANDTSQRTRIGQFCALPRAAGRQDDIFTKTRSHP